MRVFTGALLALLLVGVAHAAKPGGSGKAQEARDSRWVVGRNIDTHRHSLSSERRAKPIGDLGKLKASFGPFTTFRDRGRGRTARTTSRLGRFVTETLLAANAGESSRVLREHVSIAHDGFFLKVTYRAQVVSRRKGDRKEIRGEEVTHEFQVAYRGLAPNGALLWSRSRENEVGLRDNGYYGVLYDARVRASQQTKTDGELGRIMAPLILDMTAVEDGNRQ